MKCKSPAGDGVELFCYHFSMPAESPALEKLRACRRWSRPDSGCDPWGVLTTGVSCGASGGAGTARRGARDSRVVRPRDPPWGPRDLAKASRLLERPALHVSFDDDQEMRRVYFLIYDVFRCM